MRGRNTVACNYRQARDPCDMIRTKRGQNRAATIIGPSDRTCDEKGVRTYEIGELSMKTRIFHLCVFTVLLCAVAFGQAFDAERVKELEAKAKAEPNNIELWLQPGQLQFVGSRGLDGSLLQAA